MSPQKNNINGCKSEKLAELVLETGLSFFSIFNQLHSKKNPKSIQMSSKITKYYTHLYQPILNLPPIDLA
jgi:hypothetical protein